MTIEFVINTVTIQAKDMGNYQKLISQYLPVQKPPKKRKTRRRKKKMPASVFIDEIIESLAVE